MALATFLGLMSFCSGVPASRAQEVDFSPYTRAAEFCRDDVPRPMALSIDRRVLCLDGIISSALNVGLVDDLEEGGLFVARSYGGESLTAMKLAQALKARHAIIVVYDYCLSACASYLLVASDSAFVLKNTLVAWHHSTGAYRCPSLEEAKDGGPKRLERNACADAPAEYKYWYKYYEDLQRWFYNQRSVAPEFEDPPESNIVRRILRSKFEGTGTYSPGLLWTWNPRYYASAIKTKIAYEAYPQSQDEVDAMAARIGAHVIYDP